VTRIGKRLRVSVCDHGPGIPNEFQSRAFEKFAMAYTQKNDQKVKSSGLGLSIAKAIIEQHNGTIGFDTKTNAQSGTGTTFWFELPIL
ncbi:MAG: ATP-binding protein, partial [Gammaproteobacteria bacterium]|nr:ATP-binding protein [Gammaproteobacteria bacterium]